MTSPSWATQTTEPRRSGPRGSSTSQSPTFTQAVQAQINAHDTNTLAHEFIRTMVINAMAAVGATPNGSGGWNYTPPGVVQATTAVRGTSRILGGTADFPTVPWASVANKPTIPATYSDLTGTVPTTALPPLAIVEYLGTVATQAAMLSLTGQRGDWVIRSDLGTVFIVIADNTSVIGSWKQLQYPTAPVTTVNGRAGAVTGLAEASALSSYLLISALPTADIQTFTGSGTWTKPTGARTVVITCIGGGGGGGGGARLASGTASSGGGGGGGGGLSIFEISAANLGSTAPVTVGSAGTAGAAGASGANGSAGGNGNPSFFGSPVVCRANGGSGGGAGNTASSASGAAGVAGFSGSGGSSGTLASAGSQGTTSTQGAAGGGSGGGLAATPANTVGGVGGFAALGSVSGGAAGSSSAGGNGATAPGETPGAGGGGGAAMAAAASYNGGAGANYGGGGGGGGAAISTYAAGAGGVGAAGVVVVTTFF